MTTIAGTENSAAPSTTMRARPVRTSPASRVYQSSRIDGWSIAAASSDVGDRPERVERATVDVAAVGDETGEDGVGDEHHGEPAEEEARRR